MYLETTTNTTFPVRANSTQKSGASATAGSNTDTKGAASNSGSRTFTFSAMSGLVVLASVFQLL